MFEYIQFQRIEGSSGKDNIKLFGLSTCAFCKRAITFLDENSIKYDLVFMDLIDLKLKIRAKEEFQVKFNERMSLPTLVVNEEDYQIGFIRVAWERMFSVQVGKIRITTDGLQKFDTNVSKFVETTAKYKQWHINPDHNFRIKLEEGLLVNYNRYGFYHCPCRNTDGDKNNKDVACPCRYAESDIKEWGQCFCGLFISEEFHKNKIELGSIPERREE